MRSIIRSKVSVLKKESKLCYMRDLDLLRRLEKEGGVSGESILAVAKYI